MLELWVFHRCPLSSWGSSLLFLLRVCVCVCVCESWKGIRICHMFFSCINSDVTAVFPIILVTWHIMLIDTWLLSRLCMSGMKRTWSWRIILEMHCCTLQLAGVSPRAVCICSREECWSVMSLTLLPGWHGPHRMSWEMFLLFCFWEHLWRVVLIFFLNVYRTQQWSCLVLRFLV